MFDKTVQTMEMMWCGAICFFFLLCAIFRENSTEMDVKTVNVMVKKKVEMLKCFFFWTNLHRLPPPPPPQESLLAALVGWKNPCCFSWPDCWLPLGLQGGGLYVMYIFLHIYVMLMDVSTVLSPYAVSICDTSGPEYKDYEYGGIGRQIKTSSSLLNFVS